MRNREKHMTPDEMMQEGDKLYNHGSPGGAREWYRQAFDKLKSQPVPVAARVEAAALNIAKPYGYSLRAKSGIGITTFLYASQVVDEALLLTGNADCEITPLYTAPPSIQPDEVAGCTCKSDSMPVCSKDQKALSTVWCPDCKHMCRCHALAEGGR
jgi:hypothetical protein